MRHTSQQTIIPIWTAHVLDKSIYGLQFMRVLSRVYTRMHVAGHKLYPLVSHLSPSTCIGDKIVANLSPVCCWIQRDTSRPWHKWIVIMSPRYSQHVSRTSNLYPASDRRHVSVCIHVYVSEYNCCSSGRHVSRCKYGITTLNDGNAAWHPL